MSETVAIETLVRNLVKAWNDADSKRYANRFADDGFFTNVFGMSYYGRKAFEERHAEVFKTFAKGSSLGLDIRKLYFIRPDVAITDVDSELIGYAMLPPSIKVGADGVFRSKLLLVLVKENSEWWISAYHNVAVTPLR